jgi:hypothetical protein
MRTITIENIGEVFMRLYESEINFRFENFWDAGYTWSITGNEVESETNEIQWSRIEIDDAIADISTYPSEEKELKSLHFMKKDWLKRGSDHNLEAAVTELCQAAVYLYPDSDFAKWYLASNDEDREWESLWPMRQAEELIRQLPENVFGRNSWLERYGITGNHSANP